MKELLQKLFTKKKIYIYSQNTPDDYRKEKVEVDL